MAGKALPHSITKQRIQTIYDLRFNSDKPITQAEWVEYCHEHYGDKSEQQYCNYWAKAKNQYDDRWKERLDKQLSPAVDALIELLHSDDEQIRQKAINQVFKYTNNDGTTKIDANIQGDVKLSFGFDMGDDDNHSNVDGE